MTTEQAMTPNPIRHAFRVVARFVLMAGAGASTPFMGEHRYSA